MPFTNDSYLPSLDELYVPPLNLTSAPLKAGAFHFGAYCFNQSNEYMLCKKEEQDPRKCLADNKKLSLCANEFFGKVKENCAESFTAHWKCLDSGPLGTMAVQHCRATQAEFDKCMKDKLNMDRPQPGELSRIRLHNSQRSKPIEHFNKPPQVPAPPTDVSKMPEVIGSLKAQGKL